MSAALRLRVRGSVACLFLTCVAVRGAVAHCEEFKVFPSEVMQSLTSALAVTKGSPHVVVALLDSGVDPSHPWFKGHLIQGWDIVTGTTQTSDSFGHGTAVAGVIAQVAPGCRVDFHNLGTPKG